ncbi:WD40-repeat-containing domain protein [Dactylonectria macrodidyma]|uniref:Mitochondrial division protein 1 n=1 Tax=Dactylonectria macrodidyma TaxID=307937 RepID=A0A9P9E860_9HYPO|nr:WD40-repeat-containing domain protein [Dactylonectria macrodidyma]
MVMEAVGVVANVIALVDLSAKLVGWCAQYAQDVKHAKHDKARLSQEATHLNLVSEKAMSRSKATFEVLKWPFQSKEAEKVIQDLNRCTEAISSALQIVQTRLLDKDQRATFSRLPVAKGASFDSRAEEHNPTCLQDTRLNGMAGTGKSTIARTIARDFVNSGYLWASFFFKTGEADRGNLSKFCTTIAAQLVETEPAITPHIKAAINADPGLIRKTARDQFDKLILQSLETSLQVPTKLIVNLFSRVKDLKSPQQRILITSRPELPIRLSFNAMRGAAQDVILHEIPPNIIEHDIAAFLKHELATTRIEYNSSVSADRQLPLDWPGVRDVQRLVDMSIPLFIFAATICRFLADRKCGNPNKQLQEFLSFQEESQASQLDATYLPILNRLVDTLSTKQQHRVIGRFRLVVGSIITLASPLSKLALARLLNKSDDTVDDQLDLLHSVLSIPSDQSPVRLLHLSFRDFLVDSEKRGKNMFWIDQKKVHNRLATNCLRVMEEHLRTDICKLVQPGTSRSSISPQAIESHIPPHLAYSCLYWAYHMQQAETLIDDNGPVHEFLLQHFLHWLEVLCIIGSVVQAPGIIQTLQSILRSEGSKLLSNFLKDASRLILANMSVLSSSPLQIYSSVLSFAPKRSVFYQEFRNQIPQWISLALEPEDNWDQCQQIIQDFEEPLFSVAFSHDSKVLVAGSEDNTVRLWQVDNSECIQVLDGHQSCVTSVAFSHDSKLIASASDDGTIRLWQLDDSNTQCILVLRGHEASVYSVAFSHDSKLVVSASLDATIRLWRDTGECTQVLRGHVAPIISVAFAPDSSVVLSASYDETIRLWKVNDGTCIRVFEGHEKCVTSVAFAHDSRLIASASYDKTVRLWQVDGNKCIQVFKGHAGPVISVVFSHNSKNVVSASRDMTIRVWQIGGECLQVINTGSSVTAATVSHDSHLIASTSHARTLRLWRIDDHEHLPVIKGHESAVNEFAFSQELGLIASASADTTIRLWRVNDGKCVRVLKGHEDWLSSLTFSHDSKLLASTSADMTIRLWQTDNDWECIQVLEGDEDWVNFATFSHDSKLIASACNDSTVRVWETKAGKCIRVFEVCGRWIAVNASKKYATLGIATFGSVLTIQAF